MANVDHILELLIKVVEAKEKLRTVANKKGFIIGLQSKIPFCLMVTKTAVCHFTLPWGNKSWMQDSFSQLLLPEYFSKCPSKCTYRADKNCTTFL